MKLDVALIKNILENKGWTYERLGKESEIGTKQAIEYYFRTAKITGAERIAKALGMKPKDILT